MYPTIDAWKDQRDALAARIDEIVAYKGTLTESAATLLAAMRTYFGVAKDFYRLHSYAHQLSDEDLRESQPQELLQEVQNLGTIFGEKTAFLVPELTYAEPDTIASYLQNTPELEEFRMFLDNIQRKRERRDIPDLKQRPEHRHHGYQPQRSAGVTGTGITPAFNSLHYCSSLAFWSARRSACSSTGKGMVAKS